MSTISVEEVARIASMAQIGLSEEEVVRLAEELAVIADYASQVSEVAKPEVAPTFQSIPLENVMRNDTVGTLLDREALLSGAPDQEDGMFKVPQILEEDQ